MSRKVAVCVGINTYPSAPLSGCVNDSNNWALMLAGKGYEVTLVQDDLATLGTVIETLRSQLGTLRFGDRFVFTYSGHGSWVPDGSGDEPDGRDEVMCMYDFADGGLFNDDDLAYVLDARKFGVRVSVFSDSCFSGSVSRLVEDARPNRRFMPPSHFLSGKDIDRAYVAQTKGVTRSLARTAPVLFSGCSDTEYSYDAYIENTWQGAFSNAAIRSIRAIEVAKAKPTYKRWFDTIRATLPSEQYPQSPQLTASAWQKYWTL